MKLAEARKGGIALRVVVPRVAGETMASQPLAAKLADARKGGIALRVIVPGADRVAGETMVIVPGAHRVADETMAGYMVAKLTMARKAGIVLRVAVPVADDMAVEEKPRSIRSFAVRLPRGQAKKFQPLAEKLRRRPHKPRRRL